jgi:integrase
MPTTSEGPLKITKGTVEKAWKGRAPSQRLIIHDVDCRGLALIVNPTAMRWEYAYRPRGLDPHTGKRWPNRTVTIGNPMTHSPDEARHAAGRLKGAVAAGGDPAAEKRAAAEAERRKRGGTLHRLANDYATALPTRPKLRGSGPPSQGYVAAELAQLRRALADLEAENMPAAELAESDVRKLVTTAEGVTTARKRFGALSRFLDWCCEEGHIAVNPCTLLARSRRPRPAQARAHYLTIPELARLWQAADKLRDPVWRDLARFLIAVPCRRNEAARLEWSHLNLDSAEWRQPGRLTKNRDPHRLHLHGLALEVLRERQARANSGLVFAAPISGRAVDTFSDMQAELVEATRPDAVAGWTWHDFRRSFATALGEAGIPEAVADAVLNHRQSATRGGVLGVYQRAQRWPEQVRAMKLWGELLSAAIEGRPPAGEIVQFAGAVGAVPLRPVEAGR